MEKFIKFLEDNNAWGNFERAFKNCGTDVKDYKEACKILRNAELDSAFKWEATREGAEYWYRLNNKWRKENKSLKEKLLSDD